MSLIQIPFYVHLWRWIGSTSVIWHTDWVVKIHLFACLNFGAHGLSLLESRMLIQLAILSVVLTKYYGWSMGSIQCVGLCTFWFIELKTLLLQPTWTQYSSLPGYNCAGIIVWLRSRRILLIYWNKTWQLIWILIHIVVVWVAGLVVRIQHVCSIWLVLLVSVCHWITVALCYTTRIYAVVVRIRCVNLLSLF